MQKYFNVLQDKNGRVQAGLFVQVLTYPAGAVASLFSDNGVTPQANPITTNNNGEFSFYAADGRYSLRVYGGNIQPQTYTDIVLLEDPEDGSDVVFDNAEVETLTVNTSAEVPADTTFGGTAINGSAGSSLVGFIQAGTGATARTAQAKLREVVSVKDFGAVGDGLTNDSVAIQKAFDYLSGIGGGNLFIPRGTYIARSLSVPSNCVVYGEGYNSVLKHPAIDLDSGSSRVLHISGVNNVYVQSIKVDGNKANITNADINNCENISVQNSTNVRVFHVNSVDAYSEGVDFDSCTDCYAENVYAKDCGGMGIHISENNIRCHSLNSTAVNCGRTANRPGFDIYISSTNCSIENCVSVNCYAGFNILGNENFATNITVIGTSDGGVGDGAQGLYVDGDNNIINGVKVFDASSLGIQVTGDDNTLSDLYVNGTLAQNSLRISGSRNVVHGITTEGGATTAIQTVTGTDNTINGICVKSPGAEGIQVQAARTKLNGGTVSNNASGDCVIVLADDCDVIGITGRNSGGDSFETRNANTSFIGCRSVSPTGASFRTTAAATNASFIGCRSASPGTSHLADAGSGSIIRSCDFIQSEERGGVSIKNGDTVTTTFTIAHGMGNTPTHVEITPGSADAAAPHYVSALGSTNISVTFTSAPPTGTGNLTFYWRAWVASRG